MVEVDMANVILMVLIQTKYIINTNEAIEQPSIANQIIANNIDKLLSTI